MWGIPKGVGRVEASFVAIHAFHTLSFPWPALRSGATARRVSMDETDSSQTPLELVIILAAIADERIPIQTIAPKFTGRFDEGADYEGDVAQFNKEFNEDIAAIAFAVRNYELPANLKLSVHSGSDKFSIYAPIHESLMRTGAGVHVKTAGNTWLEELIGLAESDAEGLAIAKEVYQNAFEQSGDHWAPYATVTDINRASLPAPEQVIFWTGKQFVSALQHDPLNCAFNPSFRHLLHVASKVAAKMDDRYLKALELNEANISRNVTKNLFERHIRPIFIGSTGLMRASRSSVEPARGEALW